jgi:alpha-L-arabinofuranosidase
MGVNGNGQVISKERLLNESFNSVKVSRGLDLYLTQSDTERLTVEADENLQDIITTTIENGVLIVTTSENIGRSTSKKIMLNFKNLETIKATSGSDVYATNTIYASNLELETTSGSDMELHIQAETITCKSTSGSDMELSGKTTTFIAEATSGSSIEAEDLASINAQVKASSGAEITVNTLKKLTAKASSGGDINYVGTPEIIEKSDSVSGSIEKE